MENKFGNYLVSQLYSKLNKKDQNLLLSYLSNIDEYISKLNYILSFRLTRIFELENQIKDLQNYIKKLNYEIFNSDIYKAILAEVKDPETILAISKAVLKHGKS